MNRISANVTVIPATLSQYQRGGSTAPQQKKRVAAYARVSTDSEEQKTSYDAQVDYYTRYIQSVDGWEFAGIYTDEGISATNTKKREGFNRMISDALSGDIDLIITKSVSRFARNTVDSLTTVRQLKEKNVEVYFEKENIYTLDSKGELLITIMSSLAQEESRSISENVTWGQRKRMTDGKVSLPYKHFLGYEKGDDGLPKIVEAEAAIVRHIYALFLEGKTPGYIAKRLTNKRIPTPTGLDKWHDSTIRSILTNEKYMGAALLQKKFTVDFLTKKTKVNEGEVPQYYVENSHPAIISPEIFELVQSEIRRRKETGYQGGAHSFSGKIICGHCGSAFGSKVWQSTNQYRRVVWQCNAKYRQGQRGARCNAPHVTEWDIQESFIKAFNQLLGDKNRYIAEFEKVLPLIADTAKHEREEDALTDERDFVSELIRRCVEDNARTAQDQDSYNRKYIDLVNRFETAQKRLESIVTEKQERVARKERTIRFLDSLREADGLMTEFDEAVWSATVDRVTVISDAEMKVTFKDGSEICVETRR